MEADGFKLNIGNKRKKNFVKTIDIDRSSVTAEDVSVAMKWAEMNSAEASSLLYSKIASMLNGRIVIQIQLYGIGEINDKLLPGSFQLGVALNLWKQFSQQYPRISMTSQDPVHCFVEMEYLRSKGIQVNESDAFTRDCWNQALTSASDISKPVFICYMIHLEWSIFERFLENHWIPNVLSQIIFVGNNLKDLECHPDYSKMGQKLRQFAKCCISKPLEFAKGSRESSVFYDTHVYFVSIDDAQIMVALY